MDALLAAVRAAFVGDLADQVRALEEGLVALERADPGAGRDETLRAVFRAAHGLKGSARAAGFPRIEATCHAMESLLGAARDGGRVLSADDASALLAAVDALREAQRRLEAGEEPEGAAFDAATARLDACIAASAPFDSAAPVPPEDVSVRAERGPAQPGGVEAPPTPTPTTAHAAPGTTQPRRTSVRLSPERLDALAATGTALIVTAQQAEARADRVEDLAQEVRRLRAELRVARPALARLASRHGARPTAEERAARGALAAEERLHAVERGLAALRAQVFQDGRSLAQGTRRLTAEVRALRLAPWHDATAGLERIARDLARELGKDVEVGVGGEGLEVDGAIVDALREPLAHLVRNAVDHGLELPGERAAAGKPPRGRVDVGAQVTGERVLVRVTDDGRGLDPARLRAAARARGLAAPQDDARALALVFQPGFSTRDEVTAVSGRGVGLDAVAAVVRGLRGEASVSSVPGHGATFELALPATLYGLRAVLVRDAGQAFAVSALDVERVVRLSADKVRTSEGRAVLLGGQPLPLAPLAHVLGLGAGAWRPEERRLAIVLAHGGRRAAFAVEDVLAERELS
ncbi:MAG: chemotaxis protein CheA, partial [Anaeromyxobacteraceae bacterium]